MLRRIAPLSCFLLSAFLLLLSTAVRATPAAEARALVTVQQSTDSTSVPVVDPDYIYSQLDYMVTHYQHREAGYDDNLPVNLNGHDEFAVYGRRR
jgi:hypothetical protein